MNLTNFEIGLILGEGSILLSFLLTFLYLRKRVSPDWARRVKNPGGGKGAPVDLIRFQELLRETEILSRELSKNLEEKKEITRRLLERLDLKMAHLETLMRQVKEKEKTPAFPVREEENPASVLELARAGFGVSDIARRLGRSKEEIQLVLDVTQLNPEFSKG
jgi:Family of unknown function (DUF6115)